MEHRAGRGIEGRYGVPSVQDENSPIAGISLDTAATEGYAEDAMMQKVQQLIFEPARPWATHSSRFCVMATQGAGGFSKGLSWLEIGSKCE